MRLESDFFEKFGVQPVAGVTKYALLRNAILKAIEEGYWASGAKLPAENEFVRVTPFGLGTVQRALRELTEEGFIVRRQGYGSFVAVPGRSMDKPWHCRFLNDDGTDFLPIFPKILKIERTGAYGPWSVFLEQQGANVICVERQIRINYEFTLYNRFFANADKFGDVLGGPISDIEAANLKMLLTRKCSLPITVLTQNMRFLEFSKDVCRKTEVKHPTTGILLDATASAGKTVHLYYQEWYIPPNTRALRIVENSPILQ